MSINLEWIGQMGKYSRHMGKGSVAYSFCAICFSSNCSYSFELKKKNSFPSLPFYFFLCPNDVTLLSVWLIGLWTPGEQESHVTYLSITAGFWRDVVKLVEIADRPTLSSEFLIWLSHFTEYLFQLVKKCLAGMGAGDGKQTIPKTTISSSMKGALLSNCPNLEDVGYVAWVLERWNHIYLADEEEEVQRCQAVCQKSHRHFFNVFFYFLKLF